MARLLKQSEAKKLGLPGRTSLEPVSGAIGSRVSLRIAEIPVAQPGDKPRGPHLHNGFEECIYVLRGTGVNRSESSGTYGAAYRFRRDSNPPDGCRFSHRHQKPCSAQAFARRSSCRTSQPR